MIENSKSQVMEGSLEQEVIPVVAAIIFKERKILIARRATHKQHSGMWEFPGGKVEYRESYEDTLLREIREELNIVITSIVFWQKNLHKYPEATVELFAYTCRYESGDLELRDHDQALWVEPKDLCAFAFLSADIPFVHELLNSHA